MAYITTDKDIKSLIKFKDIRQINTGNINNMRSGGLIICIVNYGSAEIENYYAENLINYSNSGAAFILSENASLIVRNLEINKIKGNSIDGLLLNTYNSNTVKFSAYNFTLSNLYQRSDRTTAALLWLEEKTNVYIEDLIYITTFCNVEINGLEVNNFFSKTPVEFIQMNVGGDMELTSIKFNKLKIFNINSQGTLIRILHGKLLLTNSTIKNIHKCNLDNSCKNFKNNDNSLIQTNILRTGLGCKITIENTIFDNIYGENGFRSLPDTTITLTNNTFSNSYFKSGLIHIDNEYIDEVISGSFLIYNNNFDNIKSDYGSVINIKILFKNSNTRINVNDSIFKNNVASKFGGVIYSSSLYTNYSVSFNNCIFINNYAKIGQIAFSLNKDSEPKFSNIDELREKKGLISTNPTKLILSNNITNNISLLSSDLFPSGVLCNIYDDYNNIISFNTDFSNIEFNEFMFFGIESNDTYNVELKGQTQSYCWGDSCEFPSVKIIGNPGKYKIRLKINTFGKFFQFKDNYVDIPVEVKTCNDPYINQYKESNKIKSCYKPKCDFGCNTGSCVNINNKNNPMIKGGSVDFLIIILVGLIFNILYSFLLTVQRTTTRCYLIYLLNNIVYMF
ncbi:hypothetical protein H8356DRAFT_1069033 [Neocallimastix lanati (nom. inval.)]|nr:hypothetical protein H8356DRAFT_1069033 [Neocallimastix sp. JGI-2020a]